MTTVAAQRRLLEALANLDIEGAKQHRDALAELVMHSATFRRLATPEGSSVAAVMDAVEDLALAVREDRTNAADEVREARNG